jgi:glycosyltransferase involved in cell wall biosynthesis
VGDVKVLVVDDGSSDATVRIALEAGADAVLRHKANLGLGQTFKDGLDASLRLGAHIVVSVDADGQYDPSDMPMLLDPILRGRADIVLGDRQVESLTHMPNFKKWGNRIVSWVIRRLSGVPIRDAQTGFRALTREAAVRLTLSGGYTYTQEMIIQAAYRGLVIEELPVTFERRAEGSSRLIQSAWRYALRSGSVILRSYRDHHPLKVFTTIGIAILALGSMLGFRVLIHFLNTGTVSPFLPSAILAAILGVVGFQVIIFGLLADMLRTHRQLSEEILVQIRRTESDDWKGN